MRYYVMPKNSMGQKYFLGKNKLEYMTRFDADNYGGGCVGQREVVKSIWTPVYDDPAPIEDKLADSGATVPTAPVAPVEAPAAPVMLTDKHLEALAKRDPAVVHAALRALEGEVRQTILARNESLRLLVHHLETA